MLTARQSYSAFTSLFVFGELYHIIFHRGVCTSYTPKQQQQLHWRGISFHKINNIIFLSRNSRNFRSEIGAWCVYRFLFFGEIADSMKNIKDIFVFPAELNQLFQFQPSVCKIRRVVRDNFEDTQYYCQSFVADGFTLWLPCFSAHIKHKIYKNMNSVQQQREHHH